MNRTRGTDRDDITGNNCISQYSKIFFKYVSEAFFINASISSMVESREERKVKSITEPVAVGTRKDIPVKLPFV